MDTMKIGELTELTAADRTGESKYGDVTKTFRAIMAKVPLGQAAKRSDIVKALHEQCKKTDSEGVVHQLPKDQASVRINNFKKRSWFAANFVIKTAGDGAQYIGRLK